MNGLGVNAPTDGKEKDDVFSCRHRTINRRMDAMSDAAQKDELHSDPLTAVDLIELARLTLLNINSIAESLHSIAVSLAVLSNQSK